MRQITIQVNFYNEFDDYKQSPAHVFQPLEKATTIRLTFPHNKIHYKFGNKMTIIPTIKRSLSNLFVQENG